MKLLRKFKWVILSFFLLFLIVFIWIGKDMFLAQYGVLYGNRLEGIDDIPITEENKKEISDLLLSKDGIKRVNTNVHGKILNIVMFVDETITVAKVKEIANEALAKCSSEQKGFYDISFLIDYAEDSKKTDFPIIGYKNKNNDSIVW